jgi:hypothetical protein
MQVIPNRSQSIIFPTKRKVTASVTNPATSTQLGSGTSEDGIKTGLVKGKLFRKTAQSCELSSFGK